MRFLDLISVVFKRCCSFPSQVWSGPSDHCSPRRRRSISPLLRRAYLRAVPCWIEPQISFLLSWLAHPLSSRNVSVCPLSRGLDRAFYFLATINMVNLYLDQPNVVSQLGASDAKNPAIEGYIYEALRKHRDLSVLWALIIHSTSHRYRSTFPWCLSYVVILLPSI
jgi:hypothetical protein